MTHAQSDPAIHEFGAPRVAAGRGGMIATAHYLASEVGGGILAEGGNAVDAAVAAAFALGVCEPMESGLGGQTMMVIYHAAGGKTVALDGASKAPALARPGLSLEERRHGYWSMTVPTTPAVLEYARREYGTMPLPWLLAGALRIAEAGFPVTSLYHRLATRELPHLRTGTARPFFLDENGDVPPVGFVLRQPVLAGTLRRLGEEGIEDFYQGDIAREIHRDMVRSGGWIRDTDLSTIPWPTERRPVEGVFRGDRVFTLPPPGAGHTLVEMLHALDGHAPDRRDPDTPRGALVLADVIKQGCANYIERPYQPGENPQASEFDAAGVAADAEAGETTHLSVIDRHGNAVALTQSVDHVFGSCSATPSLGFLYNNYICAFNHRQPGHVYRVRPGASPRVCAAPTITCRGNRPHLVLGSPGSSRITTSMLQVLLRLDRQSPWQAVAAPRMHVSRDGVLHVEADAMPAHVLQALRQAGWTLREREPFAFYMGCVQLVQNERGEFHGVADPRRDGSAAGPKA